MPPPFEASVRHAPVHHVLGGLAADGAHIAQVLLLQGDAAGGDAGLFRRPAQSPRVEKL